MDAVMAELLRSIATLSERTGEVPEGVELTVLIRSARRHQHPLTEQDADQARPGRAREDDRCAESAQARDTPSWPV